MTQDEIERLTLLLRDHYPCGLIGCRQTGETFAALVAEVKRLRGLVEAAYIEACDDANIHTEPSDWWQQSDARKAMEGE